MIEVGQVIALKIRFNKQGSIAKTAHPLLVVKVDEDKKLIEVAHIDSAKGKEWKALLPSNHLIRNADPIETVIDKDSFVQLDNTIQLEYCEELKQQRRQKDKLSERKLAMVLKKYEQYHKENQIRAEKNIYMNKREILEINPEIKIMIDV